jgi:hypothetical protein
MTDSAFGGKAPLVFPLATKPVPGEQAVGMMIARPATAPAVLKPTGGPWSYLSSPLPSSQILEMASLLTSAKKALGITSTNITSTNITSTNKTIAPISPVPVLPVVLPVTMTAAMPAVGNDPVDRLSPIIDTSGHHYDLALEVPAGNMEEPNAILAFAHDALNMRDEEHGRFSASLHASGTTAHTLTETKQATFKDIPDITETLPTLTVDDIFQHVTRDTRDTSDKIGDVADDVVGNGATSDLTGTHVSNVVTANDGMVDGSATNATATNATATNATNASGESLAATIYSVSDVEQAVLDLQRLLDMAPTGLTADPLALKVESVWSKALSQYPEMTGRLNLTTAAAAALATAKILHQKRINDAMLRIETLLQSDAEPASRRVRI